MIPEAINLADLHALWIIAAQDARRGMRPCLVPLDDGVRAVEARYEHGLMLAVLTCRGREMEAWEEAEMRLIADVPDGAERIPQAGQDRADWQRGDRAVRMVTYFWKDDTYGNECRNPGSAPPAGTRLGLAYLDE